MNGVILMPNDDDDHRLPSSPSFREVSASALASIEAQIGSPPTIADRDDEEEFEFAFAVRDPNAAPSITADEIFSNGQIRTVYPVFDRDLLRSSYNDGGGVAAEKAIRLPLRRLFIEEERENKASSSSSSSSSSISSLELDGLQGIPAGSYCVWNPKSNGSTEARPTKSRSTGSSRRWRLRDLVVGRSRSDGDDRLVVLHGKEETLAGGERRRKGRRER